MIIIHLLSKQRRHNLRSRPVNIEKQQDRLLIPISFRYLKLVANAILRGVHVSIKGLGPFLPYVTGTKYIFGLFIQIVFSYSIISWLTNHMRCWWSVSILMAAINYVNDFDNEITCFGASFRSFHIHDHSGYWRMALGTKHLLSHVFF